MMERVQQFLTQRIGPLPAYVWLLVIAGAAFGYMTIAQRKMPEEGLSDEGVDNEGTGEFAGSVSSEKTDAAGNVLSSNYEYSGSGVVTPGAIGYPSGYMNPPEIIVNVPGSSAPATPNTPPSGVAPRIYKVPAGGGNTISEIAQKTGMSSWLIVWRLNTEAIKAAYKKSKWTWGKHGTGSGLKVPAGTVLVIP